MIKSKKHRAHATASTTRCIGSDKSVNAVGIDKRQKGSRRVRSAMGKDVCQLHGCGAAEDRLAKETVVVLALGQRMTGGYSIQGWVGQHDTVEVHVRTEAPGPLCAVTPSITAPVEVLRIDTRARPIKFFNMSTVRDCSRQASR